VHKHFFEDFSILKTHGDVLKLVYVVFSVEKASLSRWRAKEGVLLHSHTVYWWVSRVQNL